MARWIVIPSRAGTKNKGLWKLAGRPLVEWALRKASECDAEVVVTSDQPEALHLASFYGAIAHTRPPILRAEGSGQMERSLLDAVKPATDDDLLIVLQPTSPFTELAGILGDVLPGGWRSFQTIVEVPHNFHEANQRVKGNYPHGIGFAHPAMRKAMRTHQDKPERWAFGNMVATYVGQLRKSQWLFSNPSYAIPVSRFDALDIDEKDDLLIGEAYLQAGLVRNPWKS